MQTRRSLFAQALAALGAAVAWPFVSKVTTTNTKAPALPPIPDNAWWAREDEPEVKPNWTIETPQPIGYITDVRRDGRVTVRLLDGGRDLFGREVDFIEFPAWPQPMSLADVGTWVPAKDALRAWEAGRGA